MALTIRYLFETLSGTCETSPKCDTYNAFINIVKKRVPKREQTLTK